MSHIPVTIITGFLGAGKTTILNALLRDPAFAETAVLINEFGDVQVDHDLVAEFTDELVMTTTGCICCTASSDIKQSLFELWRRRKDREIGPFKRVIVETTGLMDPVPVVNSLLSPPSGGLVGAFTLMLSAAFIWAIGQRLWANPMRKRDQLLQTALDSMDQGLIVVDQSGRMRIHNARALELLDLPKELMASEPAAETILAYQKSIGEFDNMSEQHRAGLLSTLSGGRRNTYVRERANGTSLEVHTVPIEGGGVVRTYTDVTTRKATERYLQEQANSDGLTGLSNRRYFDKLFHTEFTRARRTGQSLALIMIDIDHFKAYNDYYGHLMGDTCLQEVADLIDATLKRPADTASRYGGEEFAVLLPETHLGGAIIVAEQIRKAIEARAIEHHGALTGVVTVSAGVAAVTPNLLSDEASLVRDADAELYEAKKAGRNQVAPGPIGTEPDRTLADRRQHHGAPADREPEPTAV